MYKHSIFFLQHSWLYYTLHRERDKKKLFKHVCVELRSEPIDCWYLYRHISVLLMYDFSDTKMLVTGFSFSLSFFFCVCELNKMLVSYIFIVENLVWLCWVFLHKMANTKMSWFLYDHTNVLTQSIVCVWFFFLNEYKIKILTLVFFLKSLFMISRVWWD